MELSRLSGREGFSKMAKGLREAAKSYSPRAAARLVRTRSGAMLAHGEASGRFSAERESLVACFQERGAILPRHFCEGFKPVSAGAEHVVYHDAQNSLAIKITRPNNYGHSVRRMGRMLDASPLEYLSRLAWQNALFGDDIRILGLHFDDEGLQVVTSQPWILYDESPLATDDQIAAYLNLIGLKRAALYPHGYFFYDGRSNIAVADAGPSNVVISNDGKIVAIDVVTGKPDGDHRQALWKAEGWNG